ncbi:hypothetical protein [Microvirga yunnanensis]|uniref:hypothetical protein n=1 Tax=Microvirga yunnanensis TaxID=2953740 RepID=UPI0021C8C1B7|nr:hypothetical protein [Microvirga sp. HBU67655]
MDANGLVYVEVAFGKGDRHGLFSHKGYRALRMNAKKQDAIAKDSFSRRAAKGRQKSAAD